MKIGPLQFGWESLDEIGRIRLGLDPWPGGWEGFFIGWRDRARGAGERAGFSEKVPSAEIYSAAIAA